MTKPDTAKSTLVFNPADIEITEAGIFVGETEIPIPATPPGMDGVDPRHLALARALAGTPLFGIFPRTRADAVREAEQAAMAAEEAERAMVAKGARGYAAERMPGLPADELTDALVAQVAGEYTKALAKLHAAVEAAREALAEARPGRGQSMDDDDSSPRPFRAIKNDILARCAGYMFTTPDGQLVAPYVPHDPTSKLRRMADEEDLRAWLAEAGTDYIGGRKGHKGPSLKTVFRTLIACPEVKRVRQVVTLPHVPPLPEYHYRCKPLPAPSKGHQALIRYLDRHLWASEEDRADGAAMFMTPFSGAPGGKIPAFRLTTPKNGGGKSAVVDSIERILVGDGVYVNDGGEPCRGVRTVMPGDTEDDNVMKRGLDDLINDFRDGKDRRVFHFENVTGKVASNAVSQIVTRDVIAHREKYGRGSADYPNHVMFVFTSNDLDLSTDQAGRLIPVALKQAPTGALEKSRFCEGRDADARDNGDVIRADIVDVLERTNPAEAPDVAESVRFAFWPERVLWAACSTLLGRPDLYERCIKKILAEQAEQDAGAEYGQVVEDVLESMFVKRTLAVDRDKSQSISVRQTDALWIPIAVIKEVCRRKGVDVPFSALKDAAKSGKCARLVAPEDDTLRMPTNSNMPTIDGEGVLTPCRGWFYFMPGADVEESVDGIDGVAQKHKTLIVKIMRKTNGDKSTDFKNGLYVEGAVKSAKAIEYLGHRRKVVATNADVEEFPAWG